MNLFSFLLLLLQCAVLTSTAPVSTTNPSSPLAPRSRYCANIPGQVAGTSPTKQTRTSLHPRAPTYAYCAGGFSKAFVLVTTTTIAPIGQPLVSKLLGASIHECTTTLKELMADPPILGGMYSAVYENVAMWVHNSNNHQLTWGVLGQALVALGEFYEKDGRWGALQFTVWDGENEVGTGNIGVVVT